MTSQEAMMASVLAVIMVVLDLVEMVVSDQVVQEAVSIAVLLAHDLVVAVVLEDNLNTSIF